MFGKLLKKIYGIPADEHLVWGMIAKLGNPIGQIGSLIGFMAILSLAYGHWVPALAFIVAMYGHEWGHWVIFKLNKIVAHVWLLFPAGAVAAPKDKEENERSDQLPWWNMGLMLLAGPTMNLVMMVAGIAMVYFDVWPMFGQELLIINGMLGAFNLLPLGNLDGGQFFHQIYSSLKEEYDTFVAVLCIAISLVILSALFLSPLGQGIIAGFYGLYTKWGYGVFLIAFAAGIWHKQGKDKPVDSESAQAMTHKQVIAQLVYYATLTVCLLLLMVV